MKQSKTIPGYRCQIFNETALNQGRLLTVTCIHSVIFCQIMGIGIAIQHHFFVIVPEMRWVIVMSLTLTVVTVEFIKESHGIAV
jgi:hypothetical protein